MCRKMGTLVATVLVLYFLQNAGAYDFVLVTREEWGARPPKLVEPMPNPVPYVVIHHSYIPPACNTTENCISAMQWMQKFHQDERGWNDIGYSFGVGGDGKAYVGRGWSAVGAHAPRMNNQSIGICVIGDWTSEVPPPNQLATVKNLIAYGVEQGMIIPNYILIGHRQVRDTECPGDRFFEEIKTWPHFSQNPADIKLQRAHPLQKIPHYLTAPDTSSNTVPTR